MAKNVNTGINKHLERQFMSQIKIKLNTEFNVL